MADKQLMEYFNFDESDLIANQRGRLSQKQRANLEQDAKSSKRGNAGISVVLSLVTIGLLLKIAWDFLSSKPLNIGLIIWAAIMGFFAYFFIRSTFETLYDYTVKKAEGPIHIHLANPGRSSYFVLRIGGKEFDMDGEGELEEMLSKGDVYAVYYVEYVHSEANNSVMSVEWISEKKSKSKKE